MQLNILLNDMEFREFLHQQPFYKLKDNIFFRTHDIVCIDILEITEVKDYFTVDLSVYILLDQKHGLYCVANKNLKALETPLYNRYWWTGQTSVPAIMSLLKQYGELFWSQYDSLEKIMNAVQYYIGHSAEQTPDLSDRLALFNLYAVKNDFKDMKLLADQLTVSSLSARNPKETLIELMQDMLSWIKQSDDESSFFELAYGWENHYYA